MCAYEWLLGAERRLDRKDFKRIRTATYFGQDLVPRPRRLALMNLFLHGLEPTIYLGDSIYESNRGERYDCVLTNPPFGTKGANQAPERDDFTIETSNKQLNFVQHVMNILKPGGRAAMVLPDNCLFEDKAGEVFKILMQDCRLHTVLRLPRGTFTPYSQGVKANVIFFQKATPRRTSGSTTPAPTCPASPRKSAPLHRPISRTSSAAMARTPTAGVGARTRATRAASVGSTSTWSRSAATSWTSPG